jgi:hypothetical protein
MGRLLYLLNIFLVVIVIRVVDMLKSLAALDFTEKMG